MPALQERLAARPGLDRLLADQVQDHRRGRARRATRARSRPAGSCRGSGGFRRGRETSPSSPAVDHLLQLGHGRVVEQEVAGHEHEAALLGERTELLGLRAATAPAASRRRRACRLRACLAQLVVRDDRGRDDDRVQLGVGEQLVEVARRPRLWMAPRALLEQVRRRGRRASAGRRARRSSGRGSGPSSRAPPAPTRTAHSFQTFPFDVPFAPVAFRGRRRAAPARRAPRSRSRSGPSRSRRSPPRRVERHRREPSLR